MASNRDRGHRHPRYEAATITATYTVAAPAGTFTSGDNGAYTITLNANSWPTRLACLRRR